MSTGWQHAIYSAVYEVFDSLDDFLCSPVAKSCQIEGASAKGVDEGARFLICVHDMYVLTELVLSDDGMEGINAFDIVWYEIGEESLVVL